MGIFGNKKEKAKYIVLGKKKYAFELLSKEMKVNRVTEDIRVEEQTHNRFEMLYKNRKHKAEIIEKKQNKYIVEINGNRYSFSIETPISYQRKKMLEKNQDKESGIIVTAPMPGKILEIMVSEGQGVKEGETLVILEAMKMQNEILASSSGKVEAIAVKPGDSVMKDDRLLELR